MSRVLLNEQSPQIYLQRISHTLLINGGFTGNPGLYTGEMGLALFFFRYARYTQNTLFSEYGFYLIDKIQQRIHRETSINYAQGLTGIGSAIEYLAQNSYFEADTDEVLEDFDTRIFFTRNFQQLTMSELTGIEYYALWRMAGNSSLKDKIRQIILPQIDRIRQKNPVDPARISMNQKTVPLGFEKKTFSGFLDLISTTGFEEISPGLQNGLAGWGMSLLTELDDDDSWFSLLPNDLIPASKMRSALT
jgi:hypothetical protein